VPYRPTDPTVGVEPAQRDELEPEILNSGEHAVDGRLVGQITPQYGPSVSDDNFKVFELGLHGGPALPA
jgi:hypothetical protein